MGPSLSCSSSNSRLIPATGRGYPGQNPAGACFSQRRTGGGCTLCGHLLGVDTAGGLPAGLAPEAVKHRSFEALRGLVSESASRRPLVLVIEDLHWVDPTTSEFLTFLLEHVAGACVLLLCTYRPEFVCTWSRKSYHRVITSPHWRLLMAHRC